MSTNVKIATFGQSLENKGQAKVDIMSTNVKIAK